jgi:hypothetical protein
MLRFLFMGTKWVTGIIARRDRDASLGQVKNFDEARIFLPAAFGFFHIVV